MRADLPIGVFDSGIGGLTVVREVVRLLPSEKIVYLGDTARVPYGIRSAETVRRYAAEGAAFLISKGIKMLVVACNTMSAIALDTIGSLADIPVLGVIGPGARAAAKDTVNKRIGVIGTEATIRSGAYPREISCIDGGVRIFSCACPLFVPLAEEGWLEGDVPSMVASRYLEGLKAKGVDTLLLGCTHYPLLKNVLSEVMGVGVRLIDSATETAHAVKAGLDDVGARNPEDLKPGETIDFFVTDSPERFKDVGGRFLGMSIENIKTVELEVQG